MAKLVMVPLFAYKGIDVMNAFWIAFTAAVILAVWTSIGLFFDIFSVSAGGLIGSSAGSAFSGAILALASKKVI